MSSGKGNPNKIGVAKFWGWQSRAVSLGCITIVMGYLSIYCTKTLMMPAGLVGTLMLASKIFDGVTDIAAGYIIDRTKTRFGKARPYEFCIIGLWFCTWLLFSTPESWSLVAKSIWVFAMYSFVCSIFQTFLITNQTAYMVRAFDTQEKIVKINSYGGIVVTIGCAVVSVAFPQLMATMATSGSGWSKMLAIFAIPLTVIGMLRFVFVKETVCVADTTTDKVNLKEIWNMLKANKSIYIVFAVGLLYNLSLGLNASSYYFTEIVGDIGKYSILAMISMPMLIVMFIFPILLRKISIAQLISYGALAGVAGGIINFLAGSNMVLLLVGAVFISFAGLPIAYLSGLLILDCAAFNEKSGRPRMESILSAFSSCASKIGNGVGFALLGGVLSVAGYSGTLKVQGQAALNGIRVCYSLIPAVLFLLIFFFAKAYKLDKVLKNMEN